MRYRLMGAVLVFLALLLLLNRLLDLDPLRAGLGVLVIYGGYRLIRSGGLVGALHRMDREYPLQDIELACTIADVKLDLSRAIIGPGEHAIDIRGLVGAVEIYVPYDLDVSVVATAPVGAVSIMGARRKVLGRRRTYTTAGYADAASKVKIAVALAVGDIDVRCL